MDHHQFDEDLLDKATAAILKTRDGKLRAAVPNPIGRCTFLNDVEAAELNAALRRHKELMKEYPRNGEGLEAYVDASDTGYTENNSEETKAVETAAEKAGQLNGNGLIHGGSLQVDNDDGINGHANLVDGVNGHADLVNGANGTKESMANGHAEGLTNGVNGYTNGARG